MTFNFVKKLSCAINKVDWFIQVLRQLSTLLNLPIIIIDEKPIPIQMINSLMKKAAVNENEVFVKYGNENYYW